MVRGGAAWHFLTHPQCTQRTPPCPCYPTPHMAVVHTVASDRNAAAMLLETMPQWQLTALLEAVQAVRCVVKTWCARQFLFA